MPARLCLTAGARHAESALLARLDRALDAVRDDPALLATPVRLVVPSRSLADHLAAVLVRHRGQAVAGVAIVTHSAVARALLERAAQLDPARYPDPAAEVPAALLARRAASEEAVLRRLRHRLGGADRSDTDIAALGAAGVVAADHAACAAADAVADAVAGAVEDLLDAGFEPAHVAALDELLAAEAARAPGAPEIARAQAVLAVAARTAEALERQGGGHASVRLRRAADAIADLGPDLLPTRRLLIHGYADATGAVTDFLETLLRAFEGEAIVDLPPRTTGTAGRDLNGEATAGREDGYPRALVRRLSAIAGAARDLGRNEAPGTDAREVLEGADPGAEATAVAVRVRRLLDRGAVAERIGVVARDLAARAVPLRRALEAHAVPFSAHGAHGPPDPPGRALLGLLALLADGGDVAVAHWLALVAPASARVSAAEGAPLDLSPAHRDRLGRHLRARGIVRLRDLAALAADDGTDDDDEPAADAATSAGLARLARWAVRAAARTTRLIDDRSAVTAHELGERVAELLDGPLAWPADADTRRRLAPALDAAWSGLPADLVLERREALLLARDHVRAAARGRLGGAGGGVQLLDVVEARGRTFDHLFVVGLERDRFPRPAPADPLLPDRLRARLRSLLPDLVLAGHRRDGERFAFAQLLSSSPDITLAFSRRDADGRPRSPSPFLAGPGAGAWQHVDGPETAPTTFAAAARCAALALPRRHLGDWLEAGFRDARQRLSAPQSEPRPAILARARLAVLDAWEPELGSRVDHLGPFAGHIGPIRHPGDPRRRPPAITVLEDLAACPWQAFVRHLLDVRPERDPLTELPAVTPAAVGVLVHRVLEAIARSAAHAPVRRPAAWPDDDALAALVTREADRLVREQGLGADGPARQGVARAAAARALPLVRAARGDWRPGLEVVGAEVELEATVPTPEGADRTFRLRVDRIDRVAGRVRLTDFKTGAPRVAAATPAARRRALADAIARGRQLQAAAGLEAALQVPEWAGGAVESRYVYLLPELDDSARAIGVASGDRALRARLAAVIAVLGAAWDAGVFFPRTSLPDDDVEPRRCRSCSVRDACSRGDSGARRRLRAWSETEAAEAAARALWRLPTGSPEP